ncbi:MAG: FkbM family methyltransferase, partial [Candidatus Omnitrophica bacterium]|nr:FkbM family methyltransferase [Candidatus Omnitrophota bacterium]
MEAVGLNEGKVHLEINKESCLTKTQLDNNGKIVQTSLRTAIARLGNEVDLAKVDCEGAEWGLLADYKSWRSVKHLAMEYHLGSNNTHHEIKEGIQNLG